MEEKVKRFRFERLRWEYVLTTPIFAVAIYIYFCARNIKELPVPFILVSAAILFLFALAAFFVVYLIVRNGFTAMVFYFFAWVGCYAYSLYWKLLYQIWSSVGRIFDFEGRYAWKKLNVLIVLVSAILITTFVHKIKKKEIFIKFILGISLMILCMNVISILFYTLSRAKKYDDGGELKTEFTQDDSLASPNIYWIHPDGMLGFDAFEKYYGDSQKDLTAALADRGFEISRSANIESAHQTTIAVPMLMCPYAYDTWISQYTVTHEKAMKMRDDDNILGRMGVLRKKAELQKAFYDKGYTVNVVGFEGYIYPPEGGYHWISDRVWKQGKAEGRISSIRSMLANIAKINIYFELCCNKAISMIGSPKKYIETSKYRAYMPEEKAKAVLHGAYQNADCDAEQNVRGLYDVLNGGYNSPRLTLVHNLTPHAAYWLKEDGSGIPQEYSYNPIDYHSQHIYSGKVLVGMADIIIEADPSAIIIIQSDHGLHVNTEEDFIQAFGEDANAVELWNSVISAVRVPEQYRNGEEHYMMDTPLNIARYLVNNFVGRNYEYLVSE